MTGDHDTPELEELAKHTAAAQRAWAALEKAGGLVGIGEIAERWGVEKQTVRNHYERTEGFPQPVATRGRSNLWLTAQIDQWRATPRRRGRRPKNPTG